MTREKTIFWLAFRALLLAMAGAAIAGWLLEQGWLAFAGFWAVVAGQGLIHYAHWALKE